MATKRAPRKSFSEAVKAKKIVLVIYEPPTNLKKFVCNGDLHLTVLLPGKSDNPHEFMIGASYHADTGKTTVSMTADNTDVGNFNITPDGKVVKV